MGSFEVREGQTDFALPMAAQVSYLEGNVVMIIAINEYNAIRC